MAASNQSRLPVSTEAVAEVLFLLVLIWMLAGPVSGLVLTTHSLITAFISKSAYQLQSTGDLAKKLLASSQKIKDLEKKLADSELEVTRFKQQAKDVEKMRALLALRSSSDRRTMAADIIARNPDNWFEQVTIDRGRLDNIKPGSAVITSNGVVGQVVSAADKAAVVRLLTDPDQKLGVLIERINQPGVLVGRQQKSPVIDYIPVGTSVEVGDKVTALGNGGIFPSGHPVGTVAAVRRDANGTTLSIDVKLSENFFNLTQVLVVAPQEF